MTDEREIEGVPRVASFRTVAEFKAHLATLPVRLDCDDDLLPPHQNPLAQPIAVHGRTIGNRFATHPMEGWDGTLDGKPTDLVLRRWTHFGISGAKLIWGGEAVAVRHEGRANPQSALLHTGERRGAFRAAARRSRRPIASDSARPTISSSGSSSPTPVAGRAPIPIARPSRASRSGIP